MKLIINPEKVVVTPAVYRVKFHESRDYPNYIGGDGGYETMNDFRPDIAAWLDTNAPGWSAAFDRGDWGEVLADIAIDFAAEYHARAFVEQFETIPCPNSIDRGYCPHIGKAIAVAKEREDGKAQCPNCSHPIQIMNKYNMNEFRKQ